MTVLVLQQHTLVVTREKVVVCVTACSVVGLRVPYYDPLLAFTILSWLSEDKMALVFLFTSSCGTQGALHFFGGNSRGKILDELEFIGQCGVKVKLLHYPDVWWLDQLRGNASDQPQLCADFRERPQLLLQSY